MGKTKTLYSLKGIFTKLLNDAGKQNFLIPAYQRGYKWSSSGSTSQVALLMSDLYSGFLSGNKYYLQFLTLKENGNSLEVIDGQQRLTTISILFSALKYLNNYEDNFAENRLVYQTRQNFIDRFIYNNIELIIESAGWEDFTVKNPEYDNQDVCFIYNALKFIYVFINERIPIEKSDQFHDYVCHYVYLIVNVLDSALKSEKIFINVNKGVKLKDEDLVKGLLITRIPLEEKASQIRMTEIEINEIRTNIARQWDEISGWASGKGIRDLFNIKEDRSNIEWLIQLTFPFNNNGENNPVFNYLDKLLREKKATSHQIFRKIHDTKLKLNDWFCEPELANILGFILHSRPGNSSDNSLQDIWKSYNMDINKTQFIQYLKEKVLKILPLNEEGKLSELSYEDSKNEIFNIFLVLDIAKFFPIRDRKAIQYNFGKIKSENWSIEHIFPQNPADFKNLETLGQEDLKIIHDLLSSGFQEPDFDDEERNKSVSDLYDKLMNSENECEIKETEKEDLNYILKRNAGYLHNIGNLALLEKGINSCLSNHFFDGKRKIIVQKVSSGEFVPFHTYDVFSKLIIDTNTGLHVWSKKDIDSHEMFIREQLAEIIEYLKS